MKYKIYYVLLIFVFISCKNETKINKSSEEVITEETIKTDGIDEKINDSIPVYSFSFTSENLENNTENISAITKSLQPQYIAYPFANSLNEFKETIEISESKGFFNTLAKSFKNDDFLDVENKYYAFVLPKNQIRSDYISVEEWQYTNEEKAKSVFESLKTYKEREIYFKFINWIWVQQDNKIYLIFSTSYMVKDEAMQNIKTELIKTIDALGDYETIQFYE